MKSSSLLLGGAGLLMATMLAPAAFASTSGPAGDDRVAAQARSLGFQAGDKDLSGGKPPGANPYLALLPDAESADYAAWSAYLDRKSEQAAARRESRATSQETPTTRRAPLVVDEEEPDGTRGANDTFQIAQPVPGFGTSPRQTPTARILGQLDNAPVPAASAQPPSTEDDGSIPLARDSGVGSVGGFGTTGTVGDGPHGLGGSGSGDFDVYKVAGIAGQQIVVDTDTPTGSLDTVVTIFDSTGAPVAQNDDEAFGVLDSLVRYTVPATGDYFVYVHGFFNLPADPFDSASGDGAGSEGPYAVTLTQSEVDVDVYGITLRVGDVLGLSVTGGASLLGILDTDGDLVHGSEQDASFIYPGETPLPGGGNAVNDHVADEAGMHYVMVANGSGSYDVTVEAYRPGLERNPPSQTIFLDFDGSRVNTAIFGGPGVRTLSPLRSFLGRWGLTNADYEALVREIVATVRENVRRDLAASGVNPNFDIVVRNSLQHRDPFGAPNVSRVIVGGTIAESGIGTIGIAQSIDPGNFAQEESALVLLDVLSGPADDDASLNFYLRPESDRVGFIGQAVGNVTSHEAGHFFGDWHVDQFNDTLNLMDQGGNFPLLYGVGPDGIGGTADDPDVDFGEDVFNPNEGFTGTEDTLGRLVAVLTR